MKIRIDLAVKFRAFLVTFAQFNRSFVLEIPAQVAVVTSVFAKDAENGESTALIEKPRVLLDRNGVKLSASVVTA